MTIPDSPHDLCAASGATGDALAIDPDRDAVGPQEIGNPQRPFCSFTCRLIDLGLWLNEGAVVPGEAPDDVR